MQQFISSYIGTLSGQFYIAQVITLLLLTVYGICFVAVIRGEILSVLDYILAYPLALALYSVSGYFLLGIGISFNKYSVIITMLLILAVMIALFKKKISIMGNLKPVLIYIGVMFILVLISTSGIIPVSVTNDSMYFFSEYPRALVHYGRLTSILDNFLTDASQGIAIIGTLPFFYGFDEVYGVQTLLNINFYVFFVYAVFNYAKPELDNKRACIMSALSVIILVTSMPFVLMSRWFMANSFIMEYIAILVYIAYEYSLKDDIDSADLIILSVIITGISIMRMEGALNAGVFVLCIMMLGYKNKDVVAFFICPMLILQTLYLYRIFYILTLHTKVQFMTKGKASILIAFLICIIIYTLFIRGRRFIRLEKYYPLILTGGLLLINGAVFVYDMDDYITNLKAFAGNLLRNSGWGLFAAFVIGVLILIPKKSMKINYFDYTVVCYILLTLIAGWARGDTLYEGFGDSGNRIMIQAVPIILLALIVKITEGFEYWKKESMK